MATDRVHSITLGRVTYPPQPQDPYQPQPPYATGPDPAQQPRRRSLTTKQIISIVVTGVLAVCCGGAVIAGVTGGDSKTKTAPLSPAAAAARVAPSPSETVAVVVTATPTQSVIPSPQVTATPTKSPKPASTTSKPAKAPTTHKPTPKPTPKPKPKPKPKPTKKPAPPASHVHSGAIKPGAFCKVAEEGWTGYSAAGKAYICRDIDNNGHPHWTVP